MISSPKYFKQYFQQKISQVLGNPLCMTYPSSSLDWRSVCCWNKGTWKKWKLQKQYPLTQMILNKYFNANLDMSSFLQTLSAMYFKTIAHLLWFSHEIHMILAKGNSCLKRHTRLPKKTTGCETKSAGCCILMFCNS